MEATEEGLLTELFIELKEGLSRSINECSQLFVLLQRRNKGTRGLEISHSDVTSTVDSK